MTIALVREVSERFVQATVEFAHKEVLEPIDVGLARQQHSAYVQTLQQWGIQVHRLPSDPGAPDCCFIEDRLVVAGDAALLTRSANPARAGESEAIEHFLTAQDWPLRLVPMSAPACLDGGDVLRVGSVLFVRRSERTNPEGIQALRNTFAPLGYRVVEVALNSRNLHLKCVCSSPAPGVVLMASGALDPAPFAEVARVIEVPAHEAYAANVVGVGGQVMMPMGFAVTACLLRKAGLVVTELDNSQFRAADGAMTCLSVLFELADEA